MTWAGRHETAVTHCPLGGQWAGWDRGGVSAVELSELHFIVSYNGSYPVVMVTADTLRATTREKVRRVIFAFYRNLLEKPCPSTTDHFGVQMVTYKVLLVSRRSHDCHMIPAESHTPCSLCLFMSHCVEKWRAMRSYVCHMTMLLSHDCHMTMLLRC